MASINALARVARGFRPVGRRPVQAAIKASRRPAYRYLATQVESPSDVAPRAGAGPEQRPWTNRTNMFAPRHIGPNLTEEQAMLAALNPPVSDLDDFVSKTIPHDILLRDQLTLPKRDNLDIAGRTELSVARIMRAYARGNDAKYTMIGAGYYNTITPGVIKRNVLENPAWYTSYTPYQAEISQGRLESLLNFQTMVTDLTGMTIANASVLDEGTAAAEAMTLSLNALPTSRAKLPGKSFVVSEKCHPQTIAVLETRAKGFGINIVVGDILADEGRLVKDQGDNLIGVLAQYPDTDGGVFDFQALSDTIHAAGGTFAVATDLLALTLLKSPGEFGADIAFGNAQRLGVPMGAGGPHAAFFACNDKYKRKIPGRLVGVSKDRLGHKALRLALQTREQHIRREKATSNICTAQALLANMSALYAVYHGPNGLRAIAESIAAKARLVQKELTSAGYKIVTRGTNEDGTILFDTLVVEVSRDQAKMILQSCEEQGVYLRRINATHLGISLDERDNRGSITSLLKGFSIDENRIKESINDIDYLAEVADFTLPSELQRKTDYLTHPVFNSHHSETELLRYIYHLQSKDLSLVHSMIPLGSCTMKLNGTTEMEPLSLLGLSDIHPFQPHRTMSGYHRLAHDLEDNLAVITGMDAVSLQPNSGAQGEFTGLRVIKKFHEMNNDGLDRNICLIPVSAHGTNPASAAMAGMKVVTLKCDAKTGNLDIKDLQEKCEKHKDDLAAIMITYPSTYGVFEPEIKKVCQIVHEHGGQVYMDGANMNAQIGLCSPGDIGADVCHLNLHKTFCIPHGGGGPGVGPIGVKSHLAKHLPGHPFFDPQRLNPQATSDRAEARKERTENAIAPVSSAPYGSASILSISQAYILLMGGKALTHGTKIALLNANYIMSRLKEHYPILYTNDNGRCAHEFILDARGFKSTSGVEVADIAKRLQDYGFHAPTMSWPVANTLMIEPTESESKEELDRFCDAMIEIRKEIQEIEDGKVGKEVNLLKMAPHPQQDLLREEWDRPYSRERAAYPLAWLREKKFWPPVARVDDVYGDSHLSCTCPPIESYESEE